MSCRKISWSPEAASLAVWIIVSASNFADSLVVIFPNFKATWRSSRPVSQLRDFARYKDKTRHLIRYWKEDPVSFDEGISRNVGEIYVYTNIQKYIRLQDRPECLTYIMTFDWSSYQNISYDGALHSAIDIVSGLVKGQQHSVSPNMDSYQTQYLLHIAELKVYTLIGISYDTIYHFSSHTKVRTCIVVFCFYLI